MTCEESPPSTGEAAGGDRGIAVPPDVQDMLDRLFGNEAKKIKPYERLRVVNALGSRVVVTMTPKPHRARRPNVSYLAAWQDPEGGQHLRSDSGDPWTRTAQSTEVTIENGRIVVTDDETSADADALVAKTREYLGALLGSDPQRQDLLCITDDELPWIYDYTAGQRRGLPAEVRAATLIVDREISISDR